MFAEKILGLSFSIQALHLVDNLKSLHGPIWFIQHVQTLGTCRVSNLKSLAPFDDRLFYPIICLISTYLFPFYELTLFVSSRNCRENIKKEKCKSLLFKVISFGMSYLVF